MRKYRFISKAEELLEKEEFEEWIGAIHYIVLSCIEELPEESENRKKYILLQDKVKISKMKVINLKGKSIEKIEFMQSFIPGVNDKDKLKEYLKQAVKDIKLELNI